MEQPVLHARDARGVVTLTLNRPANFNALSEEMLDALQAALATVASDDAARVVVLAASGKAFCAGHNLKEMVAQPRLDYYQQLFARCSRMMLAIQALPVPVIARVQGIATAAGCQLVAQCDLAVASTEARFAVSGVNYGLFCSTPSVPLLRNVSSKQAMEMLVTGDFISAQQAQEQGLVNRAVAPEAVDAEVERLVASILAKPRVALALGKELFYRQREMGMAAAYQLAGQTMAANMMDGGAQEGVTAFTEKKEAELANVTVQKDEEAFDELGRFIEELDRGATAWDLGTLAVCLLAAYGICWLVGRKRTTESVWFGRALVDGVLFPLLALALTYSARLAVGEFHAVPLLRLAVPVLLALAGIRLLARVFTVAFPRSAAAKLVERLFSWVAWIAAALWILGLLPVVMHEMEAIQFAFGKSNITLLAVVQGVFSSGLVMVLALWISAVLERQVLRDTVADLSLRKVAANAIRAALLLIGFLFALSAVGVDLTALSVLGGALGVGLGFGLQKLASNYVSGFVILAERSLRIGDTVRVDTFEGVVVDIKTRYTLIRSLTGRESVVPNEKLITERIENLSLADPKVLLTTDVGVSYDADPDEVRRILLDAAAGAKRVIAEPAPGVQLLRLGADALEFQVLFWIADPQNGAGAVRSDVNLRILQGLREARIEIPYAQRVVKILQAPGSAQVELAPAAATGATSVPSSSPNT